MMVGMGVEVAGAALALGSTAVSGLMVAVGGKGGTAVTVGETVVGGTAVPASVVVGWQPIRSRLTSNPKIIQLRRIMATEL